MKSVVVIGFIFVFLVLCIKIFHLKIDFSKLLDEHEAKAASLEKNIIEELEEIPSEQQLVKNEKTENIQDETIPEEMIPENIQEKAQPVTTEVVYPSEKYAEKNTDVVFQCYNPEASSYLWESYDMSLRKWIPIEESAVSQKVDELYRNSSFCTIKAIPENHGKMVRCTIHFENQDDIVKMASLYVLEKNIADISIDKTEYASGNYLSIYNIPVTVTYEDSSMETLTGLQGLYFIDEEENTEYTSSVSGNRVETITTVHTECEFLYLGEEEKEISLRYRDGTDCIDKEILFSGRDYEPPIISSLDFSDFTVSMEDKNVPVTVTITAEDNETPFPYLEYAFLPENQDVMESDWEQKFSFDVDITQNGTWIAYCRDQSGNISSEKRKIITVDQKKPVIALSLAESTWCQSNKILVNAEDELSLQYLYSCPETGEESGWISYSEYEVFHNGTWNIQVKDAAGNVASSEIVVSNIDSQAPVINSILVN